MINILLPSIRPAGKKDFVDSLMANSVTDWSHINIITYEEPVSYPLEAFNKCSEQVKDGWIWLANDDLICEFKGWDDVFKQCTEMFEDGVAMFFVNDTLFQHMFPCFPLVKWDCVKELFPSPYRRYKIDDGIRDIIPPDRRYYLSDVVMRHSRVANNGYGFKLPDGRIYQQVQEDMNHDHTLYNTLEQVNLRQRLLIRNKLMMKDLPIGAV